MRIALGIVILLFGIVTFGYAVINIPEDAGPEFLFGYFLPSGAIIVFVVLLLSWRRKA